MPLELQPTCRTVPPSVGLSVLSTQPGLASTIFPPHPLPKSSPSSCDPAAPGPYTPAKERWEFAPTHGRVMRKYLPSKTACLWPRAESQRVGFEKDQSSAEVSARPSFTQGKTFLIMKATLDHIPQRRCTAVPPARRVLHGVCTPQRSGKHLHIYLGRKKKKKRS